MEMTFMTRTDLQRTPNLAKPADETSVATLTPRVDILETEDELLVMADMPGVLSSDVDIRYENGDLTLHARRQYNSGGNVEHWNYYRAFRVTEHIAADKIEADLKNGVLTLRLPKVESVKPRRITVKG
jgi:HSP20 family protein